MQEALTALAVFGGIALVIKVITDAFTRNKLIQAGLVDEKIKFLFSQYGGASHSNVKWGLVLISIGTPWLLHQLYPYYLEDEGAVGLAFILAGLSLILYYFIVARSDRDSTNNPRTPS